jgi:hypothetical protein
MRPRALLPLNSVELGSSPFRPLSILVKRISFRIDLQVEHRDKLETADPPRSMNVSSGLLWDYSSLCCLVARMQGKIMIQR